MKKYLLFGAAVLTFSSCSYMINSMFYDDNECQSCELIESGMIINTYDGCGGWYSDASEECERDAQGYNLDPYNWGYCECTSYDLIPDDEDC